MWRGAITFETPMLFAVGFMVTFLFGGLTGVMLASPPIDFHVADSYFVVAHFHYVLFGTIVFAVYSGIYFWFPKFTGRYLDERLGKVHFWLTFIGFHMTFLVQHWLGRQGHAAALHRLPAHRRVHHAQHDLDHRLRSSSAASLLPFVWNMYHSYRFGEICHRRRPVGLRQLAGVGHVQRRRRGTTSPRSRGSAPSARRSRRTIRTCWSGSRPRPTPAQAATRSPKPLAGRRGGAEGRAPGSGTPNRADEPTACRGRPVGLTCLCNRPRCWPPSPDVTVRASPRSFFAALAAHDVDIRDVEQVVIRDRLILAVLFDLRGDPAALRSSVSQAADALGHGVRGRHRRSARARRARAGPGRAQPRHRHRPPAASGRAQPRRAAHRRRRAPTSSRSPSCRRSRRRAWR